MGNLSPRIPREHNENTVLVHLRYGYTYHCPSIKPFHRKKTSVPTPDFVGSRLNGGMYGFLVPYQARGTQEKNCCILDELSDNFSFFGQGAAFHTYGRRPAKTPVKEVVREFFPL